VARGTINDVGLPRVAVDWKCWRSGRLLVSNRTSVLARPTGFEPPGTHPGFRPIPIEGAEDWEAGCLCVA